jgi:tetratricopeptide (TPR) repeat protein
MSFLENLFGKKKPAPPAQPVARPSTPATLPPIKGQVAKPASADPAKDKNMIQVFDAYGREMFITKEAWRTSVLPGTLKSNWNDAGQLAGIVISAMNDGFFADVVEAAEQLQRIDSDHSRGTCVYGITLMKNGRLDAAEKVFRKHNEQYGKDGSVLTNLAKIYSARKDEKTAEEILWHALEVDPNQDNGLGWYGAIYHERGGAEAQQAAWRRVAALPASWRAQLWLARTALQTKNLEQALVYYHEALARAGKPVPTDLLMQMSGDLGNAGHLPELLQLTEPHFVAEIHGLPVGNNLIKAHLDLAQIDVARRIVDQLYALKRMDWQKTLSFWDTEIAKARLAVAPPVLKQDLQVAMLTIDGPIWLKPTSPASELFPARTLNGIGVAFLAGTAEIATNSKKIEHQMSDGPGRLCRALPLFLAEQVEFRTNARVQTLVPWIVGEQSGFMLAGVPWTDEDAASHARQAGISSHPPLRVARSDGERDGVRCLPESEAYDGAKNDYVVLTHLKPANEPWTVELRLVRTIDGKCLGDLTAAFTSSKPEEAVPQLAEQLLALLAAQAEVDTLPPAPLYQTPTGPNFPYYLLRMEQLLAVRCAGMDGVKDKWLNSEREIINGNIQQCLNCPQNVPVRLLLAQTLAGMKKIRPEILPEFQDKLALLQKEKPLSEPAQSVVQRLLNEVLAA